VRVAVHRLGRLSGPRRSPRVNSRDLFWRIARAARRIGYWPAMEVSEPWAPVDEAAEHIVALLNASGATSPGSVYHIAPYRNLDWERVREQFGRLGSVLPKIAASEWMRRAAERADPEDLATLTFFEADRGRPPAPLRLSTAQFQGRLKSVECDRELDGALLSAYCAALESISLTSNDPSPLQDPPSSTRPAQAE
jgi:nonribosomal peptide synthetase MxcG